jgi:hypothetical protein
MKRQEGRTFLSKQDFNQGQTLSPRVSPKEG